MFGRRRRRRDERFFAEQAARFAEQGAALRPHTKRIWLEPGYPMLEPVQADVDEDLRTWVWSAATLPIAPETRKALQRWAFEGFDGLYKRGLIEPDAPTAAAAEAYELKGIEIVERLRADLGLEWEVGLSSVKLDRPVWDLAEMPEDEWLYRTSGRPVTDP